MKKTLIEPINGAIPPATRPAPWRRSFLPAAQLLLASALWALGAGGAAAQSQPPFPSCTSDLYLSQGTGPTNPTTLYGVDVTTNPFTYPPMVTGPYSYNAMAFNPTDNYMYAITQGTVGGGTPGNLLHIGADASIVDLGPITGLPPTVDRAWLSGAMDDTGTFYVINGAKPVEFLHAIDVQSLTSTMTVLSSKVLVYDIAWRNGLLYGVDATPGAAGQLVEIDPVTGQVTNIGMPGGAADSFGAMYSSPSGLFGIATLSGGFYQFDTATGDVTLISKSPAAQQNDGANCATALFNFFSNLSISKTSTPAQGPDDLPDDTYVPGTDVAYTIVVRNTGPFGAQNVTVSDTLPAGITAASWDCAVTAGDAVCGTTSGNGALFDDGADLPVGGVLTYTMTMSVPAGFTGDLSNTATVTDGSASEDPDLSDNSATDSDPSVPLMTIRKISQGAIGSFDFSGSNGIQNQTLATTAAGVPFTGATLPLAAAGATTTITEDVPAGWTLTNIACTGLGAGGTAVPDLATASVTLDAAAVAANASIECTFTNTAIQPTLALAKTWAGAATGDTAALTATGGTGSPVLDSTADSADETDTGAAVRMAVGDVITLGETLGAGNAGGYAAGAWSCSGGSLSGNTLTLVDADVGTAIVCTIVNTRNQSDVQVTKSGSPDPVASRERVSWTIVATNNGPQDTSNVLLVDTPAAGQDCSAPGPTATCSASGGASCPGATVAVADLTGAGVTIPTLPVGGSVTVVMQCEVTADGL